MTTTVGRGRGVDESEAGGDRSGVEEPLAAAEQDREVRGVGTCSRDRRYPTVVELGIIVP